MKIAVLALTVGGAVTARRLAGTLPGKKAGRPGAYCGVQFGKARVFLPESLKDQGAGHFYSCTAAEMIRELFYSYDGLVLVMAAGIAVRSIAPLLRGKDKDPAVVVVDEGGSFAVSLLSGHLGGANDLARAAAEVLGGTPVITTSTDVQGRLAVDVLALDLGAKLEPVGRIVEVNKALARGEKVCLLSEFPLPLTQEHPLWRDPCWLVKVSRNLSGEAKALALNNTPVVLLTTRNVPGDFLCLRPPSLVAGVGCRKGVPGPDIEQAVKDALAAAGRSVLGLKKLVSIEAKSGEAGILQAAALLGAETGFYPGEVLRDILATGQGLSHSEFVNTQMGVGGVCEPASLAGCRQGILILGKQAKQGITVALSEEEFGW